MSDRISPYPGSSEVLIHLDKIPGTETERKVFGFSEGFMKNVTYNPESFRYHVNSSENGIRAIKGDDKDSDLKRAHEYLHLAVLYWLRAIAPPKSAT